MTTASAPSGSGAPVAISAQRARRDRPRRQSGRCRCARRSAGAPALSRVAPRVSAATTAYPSIAERENGGTNDVGRDVGGGDAAGGIGQRHALGARDRPDVAARRRRASSSEMVEVNGRINWRSDPDPAILNPCFCKSAIHRSSLFHLRPAAPGGRAPA